MTYAGDTQLLKTQKETFENITLHLAKMNWDKLPK